MATPVVTVASGGLPVVDVTATFPKMGLPVTEALSGRGTAVTKVVAGGMAVCYAGEVGGPAPPFTPASLTGLIGWWDASVTASLGLTGSSINTVADQSGAGNTLTWTLGHPTYNATGFNTLFPGMTFVPDQELAKSGFVLGTGNTLTLWMVCQFSSGSANTARFIDYNAGSGDTAANAFFLSRSGVASGVQLYRNSQTATGAAGYSTNRRIIATIDPTGVLTIYVDGVATAGGTYNGAFGSPGTLGIGSAGAGSSMNGIIAELGIASGFTNAATVAQLDNYLALKWGLDPVSQFLMRTSGLDATHTNAYRALINGLLTDGVWPKLDVLYIFATQNSATALLNLVSSNFTAIANGSPTFTTDRGFTGVDASTTVYLNTQFDATAATNPNFIQSSAHISAWSNTDTVSSASGGYIIGNAGGTSVTGIAPKESDGNFYLAANSTNAIAASVNSLGHFIASLTGGTNLNCYKNGASVFSGSTPVKVVQSVTNAVLAIHNGASFTQGSACQVTMGSIGAGLTATDATNLYNRLRTYMNSVGVP